MPQKPPTYYFCAFGDSSSWRGHALFQGLARYRRVANPEEADVLIANETVRSLRELHRVATSRHLRVFFGGEAVVPDFNLFDYATGFPLLDFGDRYMRLHPFVFFRHSFEEVNVQKSRESRGLLSHSQRRGACSFIYSNKRAHSMRDNLFHQFSQVFRVDSLGRHLNNAVSPLSEIYQADRWLSERVAIDENYRFSLAAENALFDGYTSEKLIASLFAGSIPIYWGNPSVGLDFNISRFIVVEDEASINGAINKVVTMNEDPALWRETTSRAWFTEAQEQYISEEDSKIVNFFKKVFDGGSRSSFRRGVGTFASSYEQRHLMGIGSFAQRQRLSISAGRNLLISKFRQLG